jgi:hypothetical protein
MGQLEGILISEHGRNFIGERFDMKSVSVNIEDVRFAFIREESVNVGLVNHILYMGMTNRFFKWSKCIPAMRFPHGWRLSA